VFLFFLSIAAMDPFISLVRRFPNFPRHFFLTEQSPSRTDLGPPPQYPETHKNSQGSLLLMQNYFPWRSIQAPWSSKVAGRHSPISRCVGHFSLDPSPFPPPCCFFSNCLPRWTVGPSRVYYGCVFFFGQLLHKPCKSF